MLHVINVALNLMMVLVVGGTTIAVARSLSSPLQVASQAEGNRIFDLPVPEALFQPGHWVVEGLPWRFDTEIVNEGQLSSIIDRPIPPMSSIPDDHFDSLITTLRRRLKVLTSNEQLTVLGSDSPQRFFRVFLAKRSNGEFSLLGGRLATRQGPNQWSVMTAKVAEESSRVLPAPLLPIPPKSRIVSTRLAADGTPQAALLALTLSAQECIALWREAGLLCNGQSLQRVGDRVVVTQGHNSIRVILIAENRLALLRLTSGKAI